MTREVHTTRRVGSWTRRVHVADAQKFYIFNFFVFVCGVLGFVFQKKCLGVVRAQEEAVMGTSHC